MGQGTSRTSQEIIDGLPDTERYFGFENFGNTCYCNSVLQSLYFCKVFRDHVVAYGTEEPSKSGSKETVLSCLSDLFTTVRSKSAVFILSLDYLYFMVVV
jgi:ubiquitin carboxyl-terminal hydrolase 12/46